MAHSVALPDLRFDDGDVIVKLSYFEDEWLLLHSEVLRTSEYFKASLNDDWKRPRIIKKPSTGGDVNVHTYAMMAKDGTFFLEKNDDYKDCEKIVDEHGDILILPSRCLMDSVWGGLGVFAPPAELGPYRQTKLVETTAGDFKVMFALMYKLPLTLEQVMLSRYEHVESRIGNILSLATYYGCVEHCAPPLEALLMSTTNLWNATLRDPEFYLRLAIELRCTELYVDALRQMMRQAETWNRGATQEELENISQLTGKTWVRIWKTLRSSREEVNHKRSALCYKLQRLGVRPPGSKPLAQMDSDPEWKLECRANAIARQAWTEFLGRVDTPYMRSVLMGQELLETILFSIKPKPFNRTCQLLVDVAEEWSVDDMIDLPITSKYVRMWSVTEADFQTLSAKTHEQFVLIVKEAARLIRKEFQHDPDADCGTARSGLTDKGEFTYFTIDTTVPWKEEWKTPEMPLVSLAPASNVWLRAVGLL